MMRFVLRLGSLVIILFVVSLVLFSVLGWSGEICFTSVEAKRILKELEEGRYNTELVKEQEKLIENLKKQNELLRQEIQLLREQSELLRQRGDLLKVAYEEERKKRSLSFFEKGKWFGLGFSLGMLMIFLK
ncbi:MAG: hypothetical protein QXR17_06925 [Candidatus Bathyarchaeia archaeon]